MRTDPAPPVRPPSVDSLARSLADTGLPHPLLVAAARRAIAAGAPDDARAMAEATSRRLLQQVINATGVLLHTNLGRARLPSAAVGSPTNLELSLADGQRGPRAEGLSHLLIHLTGCEAALVVNNGAAAVLLAMTALAGGRQAVVSRGESVEIGGGFRIPEVLAQSGASLVDVGTTNRTRVDDFRSAVAGPESDVACILRVHPSNYRIEGFTNSPSVGELTGLGVPVVVDLGSGLLDATTPWLPGGPPPWLASEPAARQTLAEGGALVTFSGDKLLGGPQAGILAGRADLVARCAAHPLARALRPGGMVLRALQDVLLAYLDRDLDRLPFWRQATAPVADLQRRARRIADRSTPAVQIVPTEALPGAGSAPGNVIPSAGLSLDGDHLERLRAHRPPVIARLEEQVTICDLRSVDPHDDDTLAEAIAALPIP